MIEVLNRGQFRDYWNNVQLGLGHDNSPLWSYEHYLNKKCRWFITIDPISLSYGSKTDKKEFWLWCNQHCRGTILCYSSSVQFEWWGFSHRADIALFVLKWC